ncbi:MAG: hypothetical protein OXU20_24920 [Myxococcales bacterium]|nr:hypothetical protein [Myxococcales bacterium]
MTYHPTAMKPSALHRGPWQVTSSRFAWMVALGLLVTTSAVQAQGDRRADSAEEPPPWESGGDVPAAASAEASADVDLSVGDRADAASDGTDSVPAMDDVADGGGSDDGGAFLAAGKVGGIASFNGLDPFVQVGVELGWLFGGTNRQIAAMLQVEYAVPPASGQVTEDGFDPERVPGGSYKWELTQKELVFQPTFMYRLTFLSDTIIPYAGIGPRLYLLETVVNADANGERIGDTFERSTKFGVGVPLGAELALGPGGLFAELLFQWGPFKHDTTGETHLAGGTFFLGYRALL